MNAENNPHSWVNKHIKFSALDYVCKVLSRLDDDNGALLKVRQQIAKEMALLSKNLKLGGDEPSFVVAPLPEWVAEKLQRIMWHRDFLLEVNRDSVCKLSDDPKVVASLFDQCGSSGSDTPHEPSSGSVMTARSDGKFEQKPINTSRNSNGA